MLECYVELLFINLFVSTLSSSSSPPRSHIPILNECCIIYHYFGQSRKHNLPVLWAALVVGTSHVELRSLTLVEGREPFAFSVWLGSAGFTLLCGNSCKQPGFVMQCGMDCPSSSGKAHP